jgi:hypothetical protein
MSINNYSILMDRYNNSKDLHNYHHYNSSIMKSNIQYRCCTGIWEKVESSSTTSSSSQPTLSSSSFSSSQSSLLAYNSNIIPCQRSLHAGSIWKDNLIIFGGYDGHQRINDLYSYSFKTHQWRLLRDHHPNNIEIHHHHHHNHDYTNNDNYNTIGNNSINSSRAPSPRDRHIAVVYGNGLYIFGGFDGQSRVNGK